MAKQRYMRQVTKEEYEVLTRFHPGEIRYYVDVGAATRRTKGAKVAVRRKAAKPSKKVSKKRASKKTAVKKPVNGKGSGRGSWATSGRPANAPMQIRTLNHEFKEGSISQNLYRLVILKFERDPTKVMGRTDLVNQIVDTSIYQKDQVGPFVSDLLKRGILRYTGKEASA